MSKIQRFAISALIIGIFGVLIYGIAKDHSDWWQNKERLSGSQSHQKNWGCEWLPPGCWWDVGATFHDSRAAYRKEELAPHTPSLYDVPIQRDRYMGNTDGLPQIEPPPLVPNLEEPPKQ